jgi:hypothetical protein
VSDGVLGYRRSGCILQTEISRVSGSGRGILMIFQRLTRDESALVRSLGFGTSASCRLTTRHTSPRECGDGGRWGNNSGT